MSTKARSKQNEDPGKTDNQQVHQKAASMRSSASNADSLDDQGTTQAEGIDILINLRDRVFSSSNKKLALALGRSEEQIADLLAKTKPIDDDILMKARGIASARNVQIED